jgi:transposase
MANSNAKNDVAVLGIDLAKQSFQLYGVDRNGVSVLKKKLARKKLFQFVALMPPCVIAIEACGGANYWLRVFKKHGHTEYMTAPQFVKPFVKSNKNDAADAEAICEAIATINALCSCKKR